MTEISFHCCRLSFPEDSYRYTYGSEQLVAAPKKRRHPAAREMAVMVNTPGLPFTRENLQTSGCSGWMCTADASLSFLHVPSFSTTMLPRHRGSRVDLGG